MRNKLARRNKQKAEVAKNIANAKKARFWTKVAKEAGMVGVMMTVTLIVVTFETGHLDEGMKIAAVAGPIKAAAAALYHRITG